MPKILKPKYIYTIDYPQSIIYSNQQLSWFWHPEEIKVEKDLHDFKVNLTESEKHGVITTLKLFTLYELIVGREYWSEAVFRKFKRPDIQRMANCFSFVELNIHAPFYAKLNEVLGLATDEFYNSYTQDEVLKERIGFIEGFLKVKEQSNQFYRLLSLGTFSMIEGAILYSSFAFLKHFQSKGKNKLVNVTSGINFSIRDESLHSEAGAWLFNTLLSELIFDKQILISEIEELKKKLKEVALNVYNHESRIIDMIFEKGEIKGITSTQLKNFVQSRLNICLGNLGIEKQWEIGYNPVAKWFYQNVNASILHDFFVKVGNNYKRDWSEKSFIWSGTNQYPPI